MIILNDFSIEKLEKRSTKHLPTKKTIVHSLKKKPYIRRQHYNPENDFQKLQSSSVAKLGFSEKKIKDYEVLKNSGVTTGISRFKIDGEGVYFKPRDGERFFRPHGDNVPLRETVKLYDKKTGKEIKKESEIDKKNLDKYKGQQHSREELAYLLSLHLGLDHIPPTLVRKVKGKVGVAVSDIYSHYKDKYEEIIDVQKAVGLDKENLFGLAKKDKRIGEKILFDRLIGNMDRHLGNFFIGKKKDGSYEVIAFDHGLSFPNDNKKFFTDVHSQQIKFQRSADKIRVSKEFAENFLNFVKSDRFKEYLSLIERKLSKKESKAFKERIVKVAEILKLKLR